MKYQGTIIKEHDGIAKECGTLIIEAADLNAARNEMACMLDSWVAVYAPSVKVYKDKEER